MGKNRKKMTRKLKEQVSEMGDTPASFDSPESGTIAHAFYDPLQQKLTVYFKPNKHADAERAYNYDGVPVSLWIEFYQAPSKGTFFAGAIRPVYTGRVAA